MRAVILFLIVLTVASCKSLLSESVAVIPPIRNEAVAGKNTLWLVTDQSQLIKISEAGLQTTEINFPSKADIIFFLDENKGWVVDRDGVVWSTSDSGGAWDRKGTHPELGIGVEIVFSDANNGWLVSGFFIFTTSDGGDTWLMAYHDGTGEKRLAIGQPTCISAVTQDIAWVGFTNGEVLRTSDRGKSWHRIEMPFRADISSIHATSEQEAWVGPSSKGAAGLYYTRDAGKTWKQQLSDPVRTNFGRTSMSFANGRIGWLSGIEFASSKEPAKGVTFITKDGETWTRLDDKPFELPFQTVIFADGLNGWLIGTDNRENQSYVYRSDDGGSIWRKVFELKRPPRRQ